MDEHVKASDLQEQAARTRRLREPSHGRSHRDWAAPFADPGELTSDELDLLQSHVPGHRWDGWRRLTGDDDYYAACSCGWRSTETGQVSPMLRQVKDHLDAVRHSRGWPTSAPAPAPGAPGPGVGQGEIVQLYQRARELRASATGEQKRLSRSLQHSTDLLSASAEQADYLVAELQRGERARTTAAARSAETVRHKVERARELRKAIAAAVAALAVIAEEIAEIRQDPEAGHARGTAGYQQTVGDASETAGTARKS
ncbi:MAG TPA: hypothetical protein VEH31_07520 [Streptosporangiaceae bacterium]|nr:hypothetical protein [Streptosporangiaceae bacterium]